MSVTTQDPAPVAATPTRERKLSDAAIGGPGVLRGSAWLTLQTRHAGRLVRGRPSTAGKPPIVGLFGFAERLRVIGQGARSDDPYADWWQLKVETALEEASSELEAVRSALDAPLSGLEGFAIEAAVSVQPTRVRLQFSSPYAYRGARLLAAYDGLARRVLSAQHVGLIEREAAERLLHQGTKPIRRAFASAAGYRLLGIARADVAQQTAKAQQAHDAMGELPTDILSGVSCADPASKRPDAAPETLPPMTPSPSAARS